MSENTEDEYDAVISRNIILEARLGAYQRAIKESETEWIHKCVSLEHRCEHLEKDIAELEKHKNKLQESLQDWLTKYENLTRRENTIRQEQADMNVRHTTAQELQRRQYQRAVRRLKQCEQLMDKMLESFDTLLAEDPNSNVTINNVRDWRTVITDCKMLLANVDENL